MSLNLRNPRTELGTETIGIAQPPVITERSDLAGESIVSHTGPMHKDYAAELAFNEEPVLIVLQQSGEKNAPPFVPCFVNGKGCEILINGRFVSTGYFPVGVKLITRRKYVEVLARSKVTNVRTKHDDATHENPQNRIERTVYANAPFTVLEDKNPKGAEWLANLIRNL
jgi:hypothetical protein